MTYELQEAIVRIDQAAESLNTSQLDETLATLRRLQARMDEIESLCAFSCTTCTGDPVRVIEIRMPATDEDDTYVVNAADLSPHTCRA